MNLGILVFKGSFNNHVIIDIGSNLNRIYKLHEKLLIVIKLKLFYAKREKSIFKGKPFIM